MTKIHKYRAPALNKGLDILELLSRTTNPLTTKEIAEALSYSKGELFRMLQVLETREYITRNDGDAGYILTNRLFMMGMERPKNRGLVEAALPVMHRLAHEVRLACHLVVASQEQMVVIARVDSPSALGIVVRIGHRLPITRSTSGLVLFAFQSQEVRTRWLALLDRMDAGYKRADLIRRADAVVAQGYASYPSQTIGGVTDLSAPVLERSLAVGALAIPFVKHRPDSVSMKAAIDHLKRAAKDISSDIA